MSGIETKQYVYVTRLEIALYNVITVLNLLFM